jgi:hypothetical protein
MTALLLQIHPELQDAPDFGWGRALLEVPLALPLSLYPVFKRNLIKKVSAVI